MKTDPTPAPRVENELAASADPLWRELAEGTKQQSRATDEAVKPISDLFRLAALTGWIIIALFFGVFGAWAFTAPLHGAVVANGVVRVESNRKSVQHLDGGIVKDLRVKEGALVKAGDVLIELDDNQARSEHEVLSQQYVLLRLTDARLRSELNRADRCSVFCQPNSRPARTIQTSKAFGPVRSLSSRAVRLQSMASGELFRKKSPNWNHKFTASKRN